VGGELGPAPFHPAFQATRRSGTAATAEEKEALPLPVPPLLAFLCRSAQPG